MTAERPRGRGPSRCGKALNSPTGQRDLAEDGWPHRLQIGLLWRHGLRLYLANCR